MLRNRSRAVTSKQALMADHSSQSSSSLKNFTTPTPSFLYSPRFEALKSPTSILDRKSFFPFGYEPKSTEIFSLNKHHSPENLEPKGIALAIVDTLKHKPKLRVQIPLGDFGIKTRNSPKTGICIKDSPRVFNGCLPVEGMELSEDYTCVISHGPNPKTTHIFDDCVVAFCCSVSDNNPKSAPESFLSFCYTCKKNLQQRIDIYVYRGDKAFCSQECRYQEMVLAGEEN
ncbi:hypothetical protein like AT3G22550 [Hibiscus trionum]|uniref:FLZ-type domain-containing protein n=1 Tax=Hibiscus trionum TaxID=183268 RepID=A0A9W7MCJ6_HIBTR|nr:hypothetical protein like AT3G22550 [Hibiscus trionum]